VSLTLLQRAALGAALLERTYAWRLGEAAEVVDRLDRDGVQAFLARRDGLTWLLVPGTGYVEQDRPSEDLGDWLRNAASILGRTVAWPRQGDSRSFAWGKGFLEGARAIDDRRVDVAVGHSQGGAEVQILAWSRWWRYPLDHPKRIAEAHAFASARPCFSVGAPGIGLIHVWNAPDDPVPSLPWGAWHVGSIHPLPALGRGGVAERHRMPAYVERLERLRP
jgi:hypothetical protein